MDFIHIDDVVNAYLPVIEKWEMINTEETLYVGKWNGTSIRELASIIEKIIGKKLKVNWGAKPYRKRDMMKAIAPIEKNRKIWHASINLRNGIDALIGSAKWK